MNKAIVNSEIPKEIAEALYEDGASYPKKLADRLDRNRSNVSKYLNQMETLGLVEKEKKGQANHYKITEKGEEFLKRVSEFREEKEDILDWLYGDSETS